MRSEMPKGYSVEVKIVDLVTGAVEKTRAFPAGSETTEAGLDKFYTAGVALPGADDKGELHWVQVTVRNFRTAKVSGGTRAPGATFRLRPVHESSVRLESDRATVDYTVGPKHRVVVAVQAA
jgi:hypothetical protein